MVTLWGLRSAGVGFKASSVVDYDIRRVPLVRGISLLDRVHVQELDQHVRGIAGHFLNHSASHEDGDMWCHVLPPCTGDGLRLIRKLPGCICRALSKLATACSSFF